MENIIGNCIHENLVSEEDVEEFEGTITVKHKANDF
jgi:hypothetical protein